MADKILTNETKEDEVLTPVDEQFKSAQSYVAGTGSLGGSATKTDILYYSTTAVNTYSTTGGQTLLETTLPGGTLGKSSAIEFEVLLDEFQLSGADASGTYRITFTAVLNGYQAILPVLSLSGPSPSGVIKGKVKGIVIADGEKNQKVFFMSEIGLPRVLSTATGSGVPIGTSGAVVSSLNGDVDNSSPILFQVRATNSHNAATHGVITFLAIVKKLV